MALIQEYLEARQLEGVAQLRRAMALRAMVADGLSQREIAERLGVSQPAVSQQLRTASHLDGIHPEVLVEAAAPVLRALAADRGITRISVFGSVARREARPDSDIDLIVELPEGASSFDLLRFKRIVERTLGREVDLVEFGGLKPRIDDDIRREAVPL